MFRVIGYFAEADVIPRAYSVESVPAGALDVLTYASVEPAADGTVHALNAAVAARSMSALNSLRQKNPALKIMLSVGGWAHSSEFSRIARDATARTRFCNELTRWVQERNFDGVDIDWEFPVAGGRAGNVASADDTRNCTLLVAEMRRSLDALGKGYLLTVAIPGEASRLKHFDVASLTSQVNWFNLMAYNFHGPWQRRTGHAAPIFRSRADPAADAAVTNVDAAVQALLRAGTPPHKIVLGIPFYGRAWRGVRPQNRGLFQLAHTVMHGWKESGVIPYSNIEAYPKDVYERHLDLEAQARFIYAPTVDSGLFISYDDARIVEEKTAYAQQHNLGGIMGYALSDDPSGALLQVMRSNQTPGGTP